MAKKKAAATPISFLSLMEKMRDYDSVKVRDDLGMNFDMAQGGLSCPVPTCQSKLKFTRWGDLYDHFLDGSTHKRDYFQWFFDERNEPFCGLRGEEFKHGVRSLMLALLEQPTALPSKTKPIATPPIVLPVVAPTPKKAKPVQEQQGFAGMTPAPTPPPPAPFTFTGDVTPSIEALMKVAEKAGQDQEWVRPSTMMERAKENNVPTMAANNKRPFTKLCELIRDSDEVSKQWRGKIWDHYVEMFHGFPPCFHCRVEEATQIHHQNPLFHEIVLLSLKKLGFQAEEVMEEYESGNRRPYSQILTDVFEFHLKEGRVCAVPYCRGCNQDAEIKRRKAKAKEGSNNSTE